MIRRFSLPVLALLGLAMVVAAVLNSAAAPQPPVADARPAGAPYASAVACVGLVEARSGNIAVATPVPGVIAEVDVQWGDTVAVGDPLLRLDTSALEARLSAARAVAREAAAGAASSAALLELGRALLAQSLLSQRGIDERRYAAARDAAALDARRAEAAVIEVEIDRRTLRSPIAGRVLQLRARPGEFAATNPRTPLVVVGDDSRLFVRAEVDQSEAQRVSAESPATAALRADPSRRVALRFERIEPMIVPKTTFSGDSTERTDTRVLQVLYSFDPAELTVYVGEPLDVYISAPPL